MYFLSPVFTDAMAMSKEDPELTYLVLLLKRKVVRNKNVGRYAVGRTFDWISAMAKENQASQTRLGNAPGLVFEGMHWIMVSDCNQNDHREK